jgi:hypothetical protein
MAPPRMTHCYRGHPLDEVNTRNVPTKQAAAIHTGMCRPRSFAIIDSTQI